MADDEDAVGVVAADREERGPRPDDGDRRGDVQGAARQRDRLRAGGEAELDGLVGPRRAGDLGLLARRQDSEPLPSQDHEWVLTHVAQCRACEMVQAAMLEASVCYRVALPT